MYASEGAICGVYEIRDSKGRSYIGSALDVHARWKSHIWHLESNRHANHRLQGAWVRLGKDAFKFTLIELSDDENLGDAEQRHIDERKPFYNLAPIVTRRPKKVHDEEAAEKKRVARSVARETADRAEFERARAKCEMLAAFLERSAKVEPSPYSRKLAKEFRTLVARARLGKDPWDFVKDSIVGDHAMIELSRQPWVDMLLVPMVLSAAGESGNKNVEIEAS